MALLRIDPGLVIWLWITFGIILLILRLTVWDRITGALDKRRRRSRRTRVRPGRQERKPPPCSPRGNTIREGKTEAALIPRARARGLGWVRTFSLNRNRGPRADGQGDGRSRGRGRCGALRCAAISFLSFSIATPS
jgi:hypothetical protein